jgi:phosphate transport system substrate-binding protein
MHSRSILKASTALRAAAFAGAMLAPAAVQAEFVTLRSADGTVNLSGELLAFEKNFYVIQTDLGQLRVSAERVSCAGVGCPTIQTDTADVRIAGAEAVGQGMMPLLLEGYAGFLDADANVQVANNQVELLAELVADQGFGDVVGSFLVSSTDSTDAFGALLDQSAEIGMAARRITPSEANTLANAGAGKMTHPSQEHILAVDSLIAIVHPSNPVQSLTMAQLADIYAGKIRNWSQVGGNDAPIAVIDRPAGSSTRDAVMGALFDGAAPAPLSGAAIETENTATAVRVNEDANAIGFVSYAFQRGAKKLPLVSSCGVTMVPDAFSAKTEEYGLQRRLYLYNRDDNLSPESRALLTFATSEEADAVIAKAGFIDLGVDRKEQTLEDERAIGLTAASNDGLQRRLQNDMLSLIGDYDRLSTTFRFNSGSSQLDERAVVDMERLTRYLETQPEGTKVMVVGFTDSVGKFSYNKTLSDRRAGQVAQQLVAYAGSRLSGVDVATTGFGELAPSACNTDVNGKRINRRVEIWVNTPDA